MHYLLLTDLREVVFSVPVCHVMIIWGGGGWIHRWRCVV